jgi:biotin-independent malonate decarboxylase gamma subunit
VTRGAVWAARLLEDPVPVDGYPASVRVVDGSLSGNAYRAIAVVADADGRFPRARSGEVGLDEALAVADAVTRAGADRAIVAIVDLPGQAFGRREESAGLHVALGAMVDAYATQRRGGRQIFALLVGKAISGGFIAHGLQAGWIGALLDPGVEVHVMPAASVARVTRSQPEEIARIATVVPATARDVGTFDTFGAIDQLFRVRDPLAPADGELKMIRQAIDVAYGHRQGLRAPLERLGTGESVATRRVAIDVRARIRAAW